MVMRSGVVTAVFAATVMLGPVSAGAVGDTAQQAPASPAVLSQLRGILAPLAGENGDPNPTNMRMVETTSTAVAKLFSPGARPNTPSIPVYLVAAHGHFVQKSALANRSPHDPTGTTLFILLTQPGEGIHLWGVLRHSLDLRMLGNVQALDVPPPPANTPPMTDSILAQLRAILVARAQGNGDPAPTFMQAVATDSFSASTYLASGWATDQPPVPVYALCAKGRFSPAGPVPPGYRRKGPAPTTMCLIVLAPGLGVTTFGFGSRYPDLRKLGAVQKL